MEKYYISLSDLDRQKWHDILCEFFRKKGTMTDEKIEKKVNKIISDCQKGWRNAPNNFETRMSMKASMNPNSRANLKKGPYDGVQPKDPERKVLDVENPNDLSIEKLARVEDILSEPEKEFLFNRRTAYLDEFDFNKSSDEPLLQQLLIQELMLNRLNMKQLIGGVVNYNRFYAEIQQNIMELQERLGITREQRAGELSNVEGNVAELALMLDEKIKKIEEREQEYGKEEQVMLEDKKQRPPNNFLPPEEKMEALLRGSDIIGQDSLVESVLKEVDLKEVHTIESEEEKSSLDSQGEVIITT